MSLADMLAWMDLWPTLSSQAIDDRFVACPGLASASAVAAWRAEAGNLPPEKRQHADAALTILDHIGADFREHVERYRYGKGPIETIAARQLRGEIGAEEALRQVQQPDIVGCVEPTYARRLVRYAESIVQGGQPGEGVLHLQLAIAAAEAPNAPVELAGLLGTFVVGCVGITSTVLNQSPDATLYRQTMDMGERVRRSAREAGDCVLLGDILHALGTLHLDTYGVDRDANQYDEDMRRWASRSPRDAQAMPTPAEAIGLAEKYYRLASHVREGRPRGWTLKALVQTLLWRPTVGLPRPDAKVIRAARGALTWLDPVQDDDMAFYVITILTEFGQAIDLQIMDRITATALESQVRRHGPHQAMSLSLNLINAQVNSNPRAALGAALRAQPLFARYADGSFMKKWWATQRNALGMATIGAFDAGADGRVAAIVEETNARAARERWDEGQRAAAWIALAGRTGETDEESLGLQLLDDAEHLAPLTLAPIREAIQAMRATLWLNVGVNEYRAQHWAAAMSAYGRALRINTELRVSDLVIECLKRIDDLAGEGGVDGAKAVVTTLEPIAVLLEIRLDEPAAELLQGIYRSAIGALGTENVDPQMLHALVALAKGQRFGAMAASHAAVRFSKDDEARGMLDAIDALKRTTPDYAPSAQDGELLLLSPLRRASMQLEGTTPPERLANLQASYDRHLDSRLAASGGEAPGHLPAIDDLRAALDDRTVLLSYFLGATGDRPALYQMLFTRDDVQAKVGWAGEKGERPMTRRLDHFEISLTGVASAVLDTRRAIVANTGGDLLNEGATFLLGTVAPILDAHRKAGKTHLCIVPHGALHYFPFHLLTRDWTVTYLPNLQLLLTQRGQVVGRRAWDYTVTAVGLGFEEEARIITEAFPGRSTKKVGPEATEAAFLSALRCSRYVHIATHGAQNVFAPAFQCVNVTPGADGDGHLYAHELAGLDLRGVDLVTLSACETALGRFDMADNLRGLPAMLMLAGVSSIIGTLWPVETECAERFFTTLYQTLGTEGATKLDAFAEAQRRTRKFYPAERDWGAFYFAGDWS